MRGVAIVRGKSIAARCFSQEEHESRSEFMARVINIYSDPDVLVHRNTLTFEFVWNY